MKYISIDVLRTKRQDLIDQRLTALQDSDYKKAKKLLKEIQPMTIELNKMLKQKL